MVVEVELSELIPAGLVVQPDVGDYEGLIVRVVGLVLHDDPHDAPDELDVRGEATERPENGSDAEPRMVEALPSIWT